MELVDSLEPTSPDLDGHDERQRAPGVTVVGDRVRDEWLGDEPILHETAGVVVRPTVQRAYPLRVLRDHLSALAGIGGTTAEADTRDPLADPDARDRLIAHRRWPTWAAPLAVRYDLCAHVRRRPPRRPACRYPLTVVGCIRAVARQSRLPPASAAALCIPVFLILQTQSAAGVPDGAATTARATAGPFDVLVVAPALGAAHLVGLVPWASDGRAVWRPREARDPRGTG